MAGVLAPLLLAADSRDMRSRIGTIGLQWACFYGKSASEVLSLPATRLSLM